MKRNWRLRAAWTLLIVLFATFLSPATGWAMVADHHELEHATAVSGSHAEPAVEHHDHGDAHMWFGHLLGHLPAVFTAPVCVALFTAIEAELPELSIAAGSFLPDPPLRPPLPLLS